MTLPSGSPEPQTPPRDKPNPAAIALAISGVVCILAAIIGYGVIRDAAANAESDSVAAGYGFGLTALMFPCLLGVGLLIAAAIVATRTTESKTSDPRRPE